jgi:hypothetical protein
MTNTAQIPRILLAFAAGGHLDRTNLKADELDQLQVSQLCASHGLAVVPSHGEKDGQCTCDDNECKHPGRHPRTVHGLQDATTDGKVIHQFWIRWPKAKVIVATGQHGIIAVTARGRKGQQALESLADDDDEVETIEFRGRHLHTYLVRAPEDAIPNGRLGLAEGVVVHGRGSFILVPRNVSRPTRAKHLFEREIAPAPSWLLRLLGGSPAPSDTPQPQKDGANMPPERDDNDEDRGSSEELTTREARTFPETLWLNIQCLDLDWIIIPDGSPACDDKKVQALAESYRVTGVRAPLAVRELADRTKDSDPVFSLLSDPARLEALKRLGITCANCLVMKGDDADERLWKLADLIHQPDVKRLDWAHYVMEWVEYIRAKGAQIAHPRGGRQPHDKGISAAEKVLGISRRDLGRAERIAGICADAQAVIREAKLDDIQVALEEIASEPPQRQVEKALELKERYRKPRRNRATKGDAKPDAAPQQGQLPEAESPELAPDDESDKPAEEKPVEGPDTAPGEPPADVDPPSALDRRASADEKFEIVKSQWEQYIADDWEELSEQQQVRFAKEVQGFSVVVVKKRRHSH